MILGMCVNFYFYFQGKKLADDIANGIIVSNRSLVLQRVTKKAAGIFTCQATNAEGHSASNELQLNVKCKLHSFIFHTPCWSVLQFWKIKLEKSSSMNWIFSLQISILKFIFASYTGSKNSVRNRLRIQFDELDFSKLIFQK